MLALVGDRSPSITAHRAIPLALDLAVQATGGTLRWEWIGTEKIGDPARSLRGATGVWCVPASPYKNMDGALAAIRFARERNLPFLGTCGGFQHAVIEFARHVAGLRSADHAETAEMQCHLIGDISPELVVTPLACSLVGKSGNITFTPGSRLHDIFGGNPTTEGYHCSYGVNTACRAKLEAAGLRFTGFDAAGETRACELPSHRFFIGTLFQPERSALAGTHHPLIREFVRSIRSATDRLA